MKKNLILALTVLPLSISAFAGSVTVTRNTNQSPNISLPGVQITLGPKANIYNSIPISDLKTNSESNAIPETIPQNSKVAVDSIVPPANLEDAIKQKNGDAPVAEIQPTNISTNSKPANRAIDKKVLAPHGVQQQDISSFNRTTINSIEQKAKEKLEEDYRKFLGK